MKACTYQRSGKGAILFAVMILMTAGAANAAAQAKPLTVDEAVALALASDQRIESAYWDAQSADAKATEARQRQFPALSVSGSYTRLSDLTSSIAIGPATMEIGSMNNVFSFAANMQYPVFAGFRIQETVKLAAQQAESKQIAAEMTRRAVVFETQRAYWEAVRADRNVRLLEENFTLMKQNRDVTQLQYQQGTVMNADVLTAQMRCDQSEMDLGNARTSRQKAYLSLSVLIADSADGGQPADPAARFDLTSGPSDGNAVTAQKTPLPLAVSGSIDGQALVGLAFANRPETRASALALRAAESSRRLAMAPLYPALNVTGNYTYADPNQRVYFQSDPWKFTGTWSLGVSLSYDLGGLPANLTERKAQVDSVKKIASDEKRQGEVVSIDVRSCLLAYEQTGADIALVSRLLDQTRESERVSAERLKAGTINQLDFLTSSLARLRSEFAIVNKQIDLQVAAADLIRAVGLADGVK